MPTTELSSRPMTLEPSRQMALLQGEVLLNTFPHTAWGGAVLAEIYLPLRRSQVWRHITHYSRWVEYFPNIVHSEILEVESRSRAYCKRLYQRGHKGFLMLVAQVEVYLQVREIPERQVSFRLEQGSFTDFSSDIRLQDYGYGTLLTYRVQATPTIPVPGLLIQQAMRLDLPGNMRHLRQVLCQYLSIADTPRPLDGDSSFNDPAYPTGPV